MTIVLPAVMIVLNPPLLNKEIKNINEDPVKKAKKAEKSLSFPPEKTMDIETFISLE
ncbi:MAG: hypothetical protein ABGW69_01240 [Nanoarchaeota archaeon]